MKREELNFKVVLGGGERKTTFLAAMGRPDMPICPDAAIVIEGKVIGATLKDFCNSPAPEMSLPEALRLIAQVEPEKPEKKGRWVEYPVDDRGFYDGKNSYWGNAPLAYSLGTFGGWFWEHKGRLYWDTLRYGVDENGEITTSTDEWEFPLTPTEVRFWVEEKGESKP